MRTRVFGADGDHPYSRSCTESFRSGRPLVARVKRREEPLAGTVSTTPNLFWKPTDRWYTGPRRVIHR